MTAQSELMTFYIQIVILYLIKKAFFVVFIFILFFSLLNIEAESNCKTIKLSVVMVII